MFKNVQGVVFSPGVRSFCELVGISAMSLQNREKLKVFGHLKTKLFTIKSL